MEKRKYHEIYRTCLLKKQPHIVYYENPLDEKNKNVKEIMQKMQKMFPMVRCDSFLWSQRKIKSIKITAETASDILCFRERKELCKVYAFDISKLENLFKTVFNDCVDNYWTSFNRFLNQRGLWKKQLRKEKYLVEEPSYVIPRPNLSFHIPEFYFKTIKRKYKSHTQSKEKQNSSLIASKNISTSNFQPIRTIDLTDTKNSFTKIYNNSLRSCSVIQINKRPKICIKSERNLMAKFTHRTLSTPEIESIFSRNPEVMLNSHELMSSILFASTNTTPSVSKYFNIGNLSNLPYMKLKTQLKPDLLHKSDGFQVPYLKYGNDKILLIGNSQN